MTPVHRFFVDENMLAVGKALAAVRDDVVYPGHPSLPNVPKGTKDSEWLPVVGEDGDNLVVLTRDRNIHRKSGEAQLLRDHGVRMIVLTGKKDLSSWEKLTLLVQNWDRMEKRIRQNGRGPWAQRLTTSGFSDLPLGP